MLLVQNCLGPLYKTLITFHIMWREDFQNGLFRKMVSSLLGAKNVVKGPHHHEWKPPLCSCRLLSLCSSVFTSRVCEGGYRVRKLGCCLKTDVWCISGPHCITCVTNVHWKGCRNTLLSCCPWGLPKTENTETRSCNLSLEISVGYVTVCQW